MDKKRNGTIELMRFIFCVMIILFHIKNALDIKLPAPFSFCGKGRIGVEFFFLVSGYLLAHTASKVGGGQGIVKSTRRFIYKKFLGVLPYHIILYFVCLALILLTATFPSREEAALFTLKAIPNLFFLQRSGLVYVEPLSTEWYIAAMLIMMAVIYPVVLKYKRKATTIAAPVLTVIFVGYMIHTDGKFGGTDVFAFGGVLPKVYLRAFTEILAGTFCYEVACRLKTLKFTKLDRIILTAVEFLCYASVVAYTFTKLPTEYEGYAFYALAAAVTLSFSEATLTSDIMKNRAAYALGKISLPLYYAQNVGLNLLYYNVLPADMRTRDKVLISLAVTAAATAAVIPLGRLFMKGYNKKVNARTD